MIPAISLEIVVLLLGIFMLLAESFSKSDDKRGLAESVLGTGEQWLSELSTDELRALVTLSPASVGAGGGGT